MSYQQGSSGPGKVYVMQDGDEYKIGAAVDPGDRLYHVRQTRPNAKLIHRVDAKNKQDAEREAQAAVEHQLGMKKVDSQSDWYTNPQRARTHKITGVVDQAVNKSNQRTKPEATIKAWFSQIFACIFRFVIRSEEFRTMLSNSNYF